MKIKLAVFFGGKSVEHEISIISALQAISNLDQQKYQVIPIYISKSNEFYTGSKLTDINQYRNINKLLQKSQKVSLVHDQGKNFLVKYPSKLFGNIVSEIDIAFPIVHGTNVEDGSLQGYLKSLDIPFVGCNVLSSALGMDKFASKILIREAGIPVLDALRFSNQDYDNPQEIIKTTEQKFGYPVIVKPINLGSSIGITKAHKKEELEHSLEAAFSFAERVIIEPAITNLKEINCAVLGDCDGAIASICEEPLGSDEILSYSDKYVGGNKQSSKGMAGLKRKIPAEISEDLCKQIQEMAIKSFQSLGCHGVARIDFMIDKNTGNVYFNEINTIPGSLSFYLWEPTGLKYSELLDKLIMLALKRQREENNITYSFASNILALGNAFGTKGSKGAKC